MAADKSTAEDAQLSKDTNKQSTAFREYPYVVVVVGGGGGLCTDPIFAVCCLQFS